MKGVFLGMVFFFLTLILGLYDIEVRKVIVVLGNIGYREVGSFFLYI